MMTGDNVRSLWNSTADNLSIEPRLAVRPWHDQCLVLADAEMMPMRAVLDYCGGATKREVPAGALCAARGQQDRTSVVLLEGRLEVVKGDSVVAVVSEPGAMFGEMSVLLDQPHTATVRAASDSASTSSTMPRRSCATSRRWRC